MVMILLHQDIEGEKRGATVDVPASRASWYVELGYASTATSRGQQHTLSTSVPAAQDPTLSGNREDTETAPPGFPGLEPYAPGRGPYETPLDTEEGYRPQDHTVAKVNEYLASVKDNDFEVERVLAEEKAHGNRVTIVDPR